MKRLLLVSILVALAAVGAVFLLNGPPQRAEAVTAPASVRELGDQFARVAEAVSPAVVHIRNTQIIKAAPMPDLFQNDPFFQRFFGRPGQPQQPQQPREYRRQGLGSGVIISKDGHILTNNHVVRNASEITVQLNDRREYKGTVIGTDPPTDLALIKIDAKDLPVARLGDSDKLKVGHWVLAIGNPFGLDRTVTAGIVSAKGRANVGVAAYEDFIQTDASINPGNSGGPLVNLDGEVVGINTAIASRSGGSVGIGFAIPITMAKRVMADLKGPKHKVTRAWLGVQMGNSELDPDLAKQFGLDRPRGVLVTRVIKDSPATKAGLRQGDIILRIDGTPVNSRQQLALIIARKAPDSAVTLDLWRDKKETTVKVTLGDRSSSAASLGGGTETDLGLKLQELTDDLAERLGVKGESGVAVTSVTPGGPADRAGIQAGDVIQQVGQKKVASIKDVRDALADLDISKGVLILYRRKDLSNFVVVKA